MKLFFLGLVGKDLGMPEIVSKLKKQGHEIVYWSGPNLDFEVDKSLFPGTIFHDYFDALSGISPKELAKENFLPPGKNLIDKLYEVESAVLTMMNKKFEKLSISERKHLYYHFVSYWHGVLKKFQPDAVIFPVVPHTVYDFIVYGLAKLLGIKTIFFMLTRISDRILFMSNFEIGNLSLKKAMENDLKQKFSISDLAQDLQDYYRSQMEHKTNLNLADVKYQQNQYSFINLIKIKFKSFLMIILEGNFFKRLFGFLKNRIGDNLKKEYLRCQFKPDFSKKYIYAPLNYQSESTSSPLGGRFVDQLLMLEVLSASVPADWHIYVKEYPLQWKPRGISYSDYRYRGYYAAISKIRNTILVPIETNTYDLIDKSQAVATVNSTAGWEAVLRSKPSLVFGYAWYRYCPGVFKVDGFASCQKIINLIKNGYSADQQGIINFLANFEKASIRGYTDEYLKGAVKISVPESIENYVKAISKALKSDDFIQ